MIRQFQKNIWQGKFLRLIETVDEQEKQRWLDIETINSYPRTSKVSASELLMGYFDTEQKNWVRPRLEIWNELLADFSEAGIKLLTEEEKRFLGMLSDSPVIALNCCTNDNLMRNPATAMFVLLQYVQTYWFSDYAVRDELACLRTLDTVRFEPGNRRA